MLMKSLWQSHLKVDVNYKELGDDMFNRRQKYEQEVNQSILHSFFQVEGEWKRLRSIVEDSIDPSYDTKMRLLLAEKRYIFLLKEAKRRNLSALRY